MLLTNVSGPEWAYLLGGPMSTLELLWRNSQGMGALSTADAQRTRKSVLFSAFYTRDMPHFAPRT